MDEGSREGRRGRGIVRRGVAALAVLAAGGAARRLLCRDRETNTACCLTAHEIQSIRQRLRDNNSP